MEVDVLVMPEEIDFASKNIYEEVVQNVRTICTTPKYSVPMGRLFGVDASMLDRPTPKAMAVIQAEVHAVRYTAFNSYYSRKNQGIFRRRHNLIRNYRERRDSCRLA